MCSRALEGDAEAAATTGQLPAALHDLFTGRHRDGADLLGLGALVGVGLDDDVSGAHELREVSDERPTGPPPLTRTTRPATA